MFLIYTLNCKLIAETLQGATSWAQESRRKRLSANIPISVEINNEKNWYSTFLLYRMLLHGLRSQYHYNDNKFKNILL